MRALRRQVGSLGPPVNDAKHRKVRNFVDEAKYVSRPRKRRVVDLFDLGNVVGHERNDRGTRPCFTENAVSERRSVND